MKLLLVFLAVIAVTFAWRNYALQQHLWPMPLPSEPHHHLPKFDFNTRAMVQSVPSGNDVFKTGQTYFLGDDNKKLLCVKCGSKCIIEASNIPNNIVSCCFIAINIGNGIVAFKSCSERKFITVDGDYIRPTAELINEAAQFTVEVSSPGTWNGTQYVHLKTLSDEKYWGVTDDNKNVEVINATMGPKTNMSVMEVR